MAMADFANLLRDWAGRMADCLKPHPLAKNARRVGHPCGGVFAIEHYGVVPDILVTAKGIADGFPLSAFTTRPEIAAAFKPGDHLSTFGGNPISCAAALANINFANINFMEKENLP